jgi:hypothetical protein
MLRPQEQADATGQRFNQILVSREIAVDEETRLRPTGEHQVVLVYG